MPRSACSFVSLPTQNMVGTRPNIIKATPLQQWRLSRSALPVRLSPSSDARPLDLYRVYSAAFWDDSASTGLDSQGEDKRDHSQAGVPPNAPDEAGAAGEPGVERVTDEAAAEAVEQLFQDLNDDLDLGNEDLFGLDTNMTPPAGRYLRLLLQFMAGSY